MVEVTYSNRPFDAVALAAWMFFHTWTYGALLVVLVLVTLPATISSLPPVSLPAQVITVVVMEAIFVAGVIAGSLVLTALVVRFSKNPGVYTTHTLSADADGLCEVTDVNDTHFTWAGVTRVARTRRHLFVFVGALKTHIVPRREVADDPTWESLCTGMQELFARSRA